MFHLCTAAQRRQGGLPVRQPARRPAAEGLRRPRDRPHQRRRVPVQVSSTPASFCKMPRFIDTMIIVTLLILNLDGATSHSLDFSRTVQFVQMLLHLVCFIRTAL